MYYFSSDKIGRHAASARTLGDLWRKVEAWAEAA
jgi:hypothetical protein